jgi:hypothetical protein
MTPAVNQRILGLVSEGGIVKQQYHEPSNDASLPYKRKRSVTIIFESSPLFGQKGLILKETLGRHSDLNLELSSGKRIRIDATWTDYFGEPSQNPKNLTHRLDFSQAQPIIRFLEYLKNKLTEDLGSSPAVDHSA